MPFAKARSLAGYQVRSGGAVVAAGAGLRQRKYAVFTYARRASSGGGSSGALTRRRWDLQSALEKMHRASRPVSAAQTSAAPRAPFLGSRAT